MLFNFAFLSNNSTTFSVLSLFFFMLFLNFFIIIFILLIPSKYNIIIKQVSLLFSSKIFIISMMIYKINFLDLLSIQKSLNFSIEICNTALFINNKIFFSCDNISTVLIVLTTFLTFICLVISLEIGNFKTYSICFLIMELLLLIVWSVFDIFIFYLFFESVLIPMFLIIKLYGSRSRKIRAAFLFFMYTVVGSISMLIAILFMYNRTGTCNTLYYQLINNFTLIEQKYLWIAFFLAFAVKVPMFPFHLWLPEAHVEAPTSGSVILAGVLLKLGSYGMLRFLNPFFNHAGIFFTPFVHTLSICGIIYASLTAFRQNDLKRVIAYASIAHMNLIVIGVFSNSIYAFQGVIFQMIGHGLVASLLFLMVGIIYDRSLTRLISNYSGLTIIMPTFSTFFLFATIANMAFPGTSNFIGEILLFFGIFLTNPISGYFSVLGIFLCSTYSIWLFNRIMYVTLSESITNFKDVDSLDLVVISFLTIFFFVIRVIS